MMALKTSPLLLTVQSNWAATKKLKNSLVSTVVIEVTTGFGHGTVLGIADKVIDAVKAGAIKHFFLVGGCDGAKVDRNYYTEFVKTNSR